MNKTKRSHPKEWEDEFFMIMHELAYRGMYKYHIFSMEEIDAYVNIRYDEKELLSDDPDGPMTAEKAEKICKIKVLRFITWRDRVLAYKRLGILRRNDGDQFINRGYNFPGGYETSSDEEGECGYGSDPEDPKEPEEEKENRAEYKKGKQGLIVQRRRKLKKNKEPK